MRRTARLCVLTGIQGRTAYLMPPLPSSRGLSLKATWKVRGVLKVQPGLMAGWPAVRYEAIGFQLAATER